MKHEERADTIHFTLSDLHKVEQSLIEKIQNCNEEHSQPLFKKFVLRYLEKKYKDAPKEEDDNEEDKEKDKEEDEDKEDREKEMMMTKEKRRMMRTVMMMMIKEDLQVRRHKSLPTQMKILMKNPLSSLLRR